MGALSVLNNDQQEQQPCDGCRLSAACAEHRLACKSYVHWMAYGRHMPPQGLPSRAYYDVIHADPKDVSGMTSKARAHEQNLVHRARMRKMADKFATDRSAQA